jgi:hypothetical protein
MKLDDINPDAAGSSLLDHESVRILHAHVSCASETHALASTAALARQPGAAARRGGACSTPMDSPAVLPREHSA